MNSILVWLEATVRGIQDGEPKESVIQHGYNLGTRIEDDDLTTEGQDAWKALTATEPPGRARQMDQEVLAFMKEHMANFLAVMGGHQDNMIEGLGQYLMEEKFMGWSHWREHGRDQSVTNYAEAGS